MTRAVKTHARKRNTQGRSPARRGARPGPRRRPRPASRQRLSVAGLFGPVDIASVVFFRVAFGSLIVVEVVREFTNGWIREFYIDPTFRFTYFGFGWVRPWPGEWMYVFFALLGLVAVLFIVGAWYRVTAPLMFLGLTYAFLLDQSRYLNHGYLILLFAFLMIFVPANRAFSVDARRRPEIRSATIPAWSLWILRFQMGVVYLFGGIAKMNVDWIQGRPLGAWLARSADFPVIGGLFTQSWLVHLFAYGSMLLDLLAVPLLLWRRTRVPTFAVLVVFHLVNGRLFHIGVFPWLAIAATTLFLRPDWPRLVLDRMPWPKKRDLRTRDTKPAGSSRIPPARRKVALWLLGAYVALQVLVPLRHFFYPGEVSWTEEGHRFAWQMMLRQKEARARFYVTTPGSGETFEIDPRDLIPVYSYVKMATQPHLILQFAHYLDNRYSPPAGPPVEVRAYVFASLNGRPTQFLVDPRVDLASVDPGIPPADWIVPLGSTFWLPPPKVSAAPPDLA